MDDQVRQWLVFMFVFIVSVTVHEFAHAITADRLGDQTPRAQGRISLNPIDHLEPLGTIMMGVAAWYGIGIGWGKPVLVNPLKLKHMRRDMMLIAAAGPISNLLMATIVGVFLRADRTYDFLPMSDEWDDFLFNFVWINVSLFIFNLIPIPPLDGSKILAGVLPYNMSVRYSNVMQQWGFLLFMLMIVSRAGSYIMSPPVNWIVGILLG